MTNISNNTNDGIDNSEHILDMHRQVDMLIENILANTDNAFNILKLHEEDADQDIVDVYRIICNDILDCEKLAKGKYDLFKNNFNSLSNSKDALTNMKNFENLFEEIEKLEKSSNDLLVSLINKLKI